MTLEQFLAFALVGGAVVAFLSGRWRFDVVALVALVIGVLIGLIPVKEAFSGFASDIVVIIASALVLSAAVARSGLVDTLIAPLLPLLKDERSQVPFFGGVTALLSMATKNVGALALLMPSALSAAKRTGVSPARLLMPMAFASLVGGLAVLVGTSPNIIVSGVRQEALGRPFQMFDFMPVGAALTVLAIAYLTLAYRLLPKGRIAQSSIEAALDAQTYVTEVEAPKGWSWGRSTVGTIRSFGGGAIEVVALLRDGRRIDAPHSNLKVRPGDRLLVEANHAELDDLIVRARLKLTRADRPIVRGTRTDEIRVVEAIVGRNSDLIGMTARQVDLHRAWGVNLLGVSRSGFRIRGPLARVPLHAGDVLVLQGSEKALPDVLKALDCLPLAEREVRLGGIRRTVLAPAILAAAVTTVATGLLPVAAAFFTAAVLVLAAGALRMREAYAALDAPVLILVAALIPVSGAIDSTGGTQLIAEALSGWFEGLPPLVVLTAMMFVAMAATPFLNNAATVLIVAPIGLGLARQLGLSPDPFLMAVAVGAGCDFLTPIGHQSNTLVYGPGGYRFGDYARLGAPLSLLVLAVAPLLISLVWPFQP